MNIRFIEGQGADPAQEATNLLARAAAIASLATIEPPEPLADAPPEEAAARAQPPDAPAQAYETIDAEVAVDLAGEAPHLPTMDDVATLTPDSDFSGFVARGVDQAVRRSALKKLFADPHFNTMDGLDIYIDDYTKPSPLSETMLASLRHAARLFERVADAETDAEIDADAPAPPIAPDLATEPQDQQHPPETETR